MAVQYCNYDIKGTLGVVGAATIGGEISFSNNNVGVTMKDAAGTNTRVFRLNSGNTMYIGPIDSYAGGQIFYGAASQVTGHKFHVGGTPKLTIDSSGNATFAGDVSVEDNLYLTDAGTVRGKIQLNSSDRDNVDIKAISLGSTMNFFTADTLALGLDASQNATFAGDIIVPNGDITTIGGNNLTISGTVTDHAGISFATNSILPCVTGALTNNVVDLGQNGNVYKNLYLGSEIISGGGATFADQLTINTISNATSDTDKFLVSDSGVIKYRTGAQVLSDIGAASSGSLGNYLPLSGGTLTGPVGFGANAAGQDVYFYGNATGELMFWDASESRLTINHDTNDSGLDVFTVSSAAMSYPQLRVGRNTAEFWGVYTDDRNAYLVHRQDETTGTMSTKFDQWDSNTSDTLGFWAWRSGNASGGSMSTALELKQSGDAIFTGDVKANTHFTSSDTNVTLSTDSNGTVFLRPNGKSSTTAQSTFTTALASIGTGATFAGNIAMNDNDITGIDQLTFTSGTYLTDVSSNYLQLRYASTAAGGIIVLDGDGTTQGYLYADGNATSSFGLLDGSGSWAVRCVEDQYVELRYDNSTKFRTASTGINVTGAGNFTGNIVANDGVSGQITISPNNINSNNNLILGTSGANIEMYTNGQAYYDAVSHSFRDSDASPTYFSVTASQVNSFVKLSVASNKIIDLATPTISTDAANKAYVDAQIQTIPSGLNFQGNWNANTNSPTLASGTGTPGFYYNVSVAGSTNLDGETDWQVGDWAVFVENGTNDFWEKIDNTSALTGVGVSGRVTFWDGTNTLGSDSDFTYNSTTNVLTIGGFDSAGWNDAYNNTITGFSDSGSSTITLTLTQRDGGTLTTSFSNPQGNVTTGGFTSGRVPFANSTTNLDNSANLTFDGTNLTVGGNLSAAGYNIFGLGLSTGTWYGDLGSNGYTRETGLAMTGGSEFVVLSKNGQGSTLVDGAYLAYESANGFFGSYNSAYGNLTGIQATAANTLTVKQLDGGTANLAITSIANATSDTDKFLVSDSGVVKYRTGAQVLSDIGGAPATGGAYLPLTGGVMTGNVRWNDAKAALFGSGQDMHIYHYQNENYIDTYKGNLYLSVYENDKDIVFRTDNGSGGIATYFFLDGSATQTTFQLDTRHNDNVKAKFGDGEDLKIYHDGSDSYMENLTGVFYIMQRQNDGNLVFTCDDGSGGDTEYFRLDGGAEQNVVSKNMRFEDNIQAQFGAGTDLRIYHDGSNSFIDETGTGSLVVKTNALLVRNPSDASMLDAQSGGPINLYYNGSKKFETTSAGVTVTGDITFGDSHFIGDDADDNLLIQSSANENVIINSPDDDVLIRTAGTTRLQITNTLATFAGDITVSGGDITLGGSTGRIQGIDTVSAGTDAANKDYVDTAVAGSGSGTVTSVSSATTSQLTVSQSSPAPALSIVTAAVANGGTGLATGNQIYDWGVAAFAPIVSGGYLPLSGGTMTGDLRLNDNIQLFLGSQTDFVLAHNGSNSYISNYTGDLYIEQAKDDGDIIFKSDNGSGGTATYFRLDGGSVTNQFLKTVKLYDNVPLWIGDDNDLQIFHDGSNSYIQEAGTGELIISSGTVLRLRSDASPTGEEYINCTRDGAVALFYNNVEKFHTSASGVDVLGDLTVDTTAVIDGATTINGQLNQNGDIKLGASASIVLDDTPTGQTTSGSGTIVEWSVSESTTAGTLYVVKTNGGWTTADADSEAKSTAMAAIALGSNATSGMLLQGFFYKASHGFAIGSPLYISNTAGAFSNTRPTGTGDYVRIIGYATSTNYIYFDPDKTWVKID